MQNDLLGVESCFWVLFSSKLFGRMESINVAGALQEVGDAD